MTGPWTATLTDGEHTIILYFLAVAALALLAGAVRSWLTRVEVGSRYRPTVAARLAVAIIATLSYVAVIIGFLVGYRHTADGWHPTANAVLSFLPRYIDWSVTVPLLSLELLAVTTFAGAVLRRNQLAAVVTSFLMIFCGFVAVFVVGDDLAALIGWAIASCVFWVTTSVLLIRAVRQSFPYLTVLSAAALRTGTALLLVSWIVYPLVFLLQVLAHGGMWTTVIQVALCVTDVVVKIGFGGIAHRVAKLRTAEDVRAGDDVHPESIWASSIKLSDAGRPHEVYLAEGASVHPSRDRPSSGSAVPSEAPEDLGE
jgi:bacteriorhodopsin